MPDAESPAARRRRQWRTAMCAPFAAGSVPQMLLAAAVGAGIGMATRAAVPDPRAREPVTGWVTLPGEAFIRLMKCFDLPLLALNICVGVQVRAWA